jgi:hypothetical protein
MKKFLHVFRINRDLVAQHPPLNTFFFPNAGAEYSRYGSRTKPG